MLRIHFIQHWFTLADLACEEALHDSASLRRVVGIDLGRAPVPDATTLLKFRKLLNDNQLGEALFAKVGQELQERCFKLNTGTIVDASIISAPSSEQVPHSGAGGASVRRRQALVGVWQGALPGLAEERHAGVHRIGAGQPLPQPGKADMAQVRP